MVTSHVETSECDHIFPNSTPRHVMIVEQASESVAALQLTLSQAGFRVSTLSRAEDASSAVDREKPDLVMLDWDVPAVIAMDLIRQIRRDATTRGPRLIALSHFSSEQHVCSGFELGVDDYVVKPYSVREVVARVRAVLRPTWSTATDDPVQLSFQEMHMDTVSGRLSIDDRVVQLRNMEFRLLQFLLRRPERAISRDQLLHSVWGHDCRTGPRAVDVTVQRIRRALAAHNCDQYLQTIRGLGYRLSAESG